MSRISQLLQTFRRFDWIVLAAVLILTMVGLAAIYSVDLSRTASLDFFPTQALAFGLGLVAIFIIASIHISFFESSARLTYLLALILLIAVLMFGLTIRGTTGWFRVAGFSFQPAEFAKLALVIFLAWRITRQGRRFATWQFVAATGVMSFIFAALVMAQPDLGSAAIMLGVWFLLLLLTGTKKRYLLFLIGAAVLVGVVGWFFFLQPYQKERLSTFINPAADPLGSGYNITQSIIAVGAGKLTGRGLGFGSQSQLHFLPEAQTDFIFSVIGEELGFVGVILLLGVYLVLLWRLVHLAKSCSHDFSAFLILGVAALFLLQVVINVGAAIGLLPITGVTLPFVSYGGSSLLINLVLIGLVESAVISSVRRY